jgi:hypothetical protein
VDYGGTLAAIVVSYPTGFVMSLHVSSGLLGCWLDIFSSPGLSAGEKQLRVNRTCIPML